LRIAAARLRYAEMFKFFKDERRHAKRFKVSVDLTYGSNADDQTMTTALDLSDTGVSFRSSKTFQTGQIIRVQLPLPDDPGTHLALEAEIKHCEQSIIGVAFRNLSSEQRRTLHRYFAEAEPAAKT